MAATESAAPRKAVATFGARSKSQTVVLVGQFAATRKEALEQLLSEYPTRLGVPVQHSTFPPKEGEEDGVHFHFTAKDVMEDTIAAGSTFVEFSHREGEYVGTSRAAIDEVRASGRTCVLDVDAHSAALVMKSGIEAVYVLLQPPSTEALHQRLKESGLSDETTGKELALAALETELLQRERKQFSHALREGLDAAETADVLRDALLPMAPPVVICGPSGVGKGTMINLLLKEFPDDFGFSVSHTTRAPRPGEEDGVHYHFTSKEAMEAAIENGEFVEHANVHGNYYGTSLASVKTVAREGKSCVLDIDVQGARAVKASSLGAVFIFIAPPSIEQLEERLRGRGTETEEKIQLRLANARAEMAAAKERGFFDHVIVNEHLGTAYSTLRRKLTGISPPVVICGPSGVGKGTLIDKLLKCAPDAFGFSVSHTTRAPRPGERNGVHYHFTSKAEMEAAIANGEFVEHANVHGNYYGTSVAAVDAVARTGKSCVLDIDVQGARAVKASSLGAVFVFIAPPSIEQLEARLRGRGTETEEKIQLRLANARAEMAAAQEPGFFDHVIVNDDLLAAFCQLRLVLTGMAPPILICGPSGVGKGTLIGKLLDDFPDDFGFSVSHTTRAPRPGEEDGVHYHFATKEAMEAAIESGEFVEHAKVHGNYYGTSVAAVESVTKLGKSCVLDIDVQGARAVKASSLGAVFVFIAPPSIEQLEARLRGRGTETEEKIQLRLANARSEIAAAEEPRLWDHVVVNDELEACYVNLKRVVSSYRVLNLGQRFVARCLGQLTPDLPPPVADDGSTALAYHVGQHRLSLRGAFVSQIRLLSRCAGLHTLDVAHNKLADLRPLGSLKYLLSLDASHNVLSEGAWFEPPLNLQELNLSHNLISSLEVVGAHRHLRRLDVSNNRLASMAGMGPMESLEKLDLSDNQIGTIGGLSQTLFLRALRLGNNQIVAADGLRALERLELLDLSNNLLTSLDGLQACTSLMDLHLADNAVSNSNEMAYVAPLTLLRTLDLSRNPVVSCGSEAVPYRLHVARQLPSLTLLDGADISAEEKVGAAWHFGSADEELRKIRATHMPPAEKQAPAPARLAATALRA